MRGVTVTTRRKRRNDKAGHQSEKYQSLDIELFPRENGYRNKTVSDLYMRSKTQRATRRRDDRSSLLWFIHEN